MIDIDMVLNCYLFFDGFCKNDNLNYYLSGGTLLGTVRYQGFIPWDDDLDIMMPRSDYNKLIKIFKHDRYQLSCCENDIDYNTPFARLWDTGTILKWKIWQEKNNGAFKDIFPIDRYPTSNIIAKLHMLRLKWFRVKINSSIRIGYNENEKNRFLKRILKLIHGQIGNYYSKK